MACPPVRGGSVIADIRAQIASLPWSPGPYPLERQSARKPRTSLDVQSTAFNKPTLEHRRHQRSPSSYFSTLGGRPSKRARPTLGTSMDPQSGESGPSEDQRLGSRNHDRTGLGGNDGRGLGARTGELLRRGHSDGDVLSRPHDTFNDQLLVNGETWMDFLRSSGTGRDEQERAQIAVRRAAMMLTDRRRRLTDLQPDYIRRRTSSNLLFGQLENGRRRSGIPYPVTDHTPTQPLVTGGRDRSSRQSTLDRPIPRRPSIGMQHSSRSNDISLPGWQPDAEVTKCPICSTSFSFWYRKHHCRKCGRVVCANCSPHRITIPRQYIVHPPEQDPAPSSGTDSGIEIIDLTGETGENSGTSMRPPPQTHRSQRHDHRIDPALGGGQEVRLCNPCVPDPNPLPHLYPSPNRISLDSFPRPESLDPGPSSSIAPPRRSSIQYRLPREPVRASPTPQSYDFGTEPNSEASLDILIILPFTRPPLTISSVVYLNLRQHLHGRRISYRRTVLRQTMHCIL